MNHFSDHQGFQERLNCLNNCPIKLRTKTFSFKNHIFYCLEHEEPLKEKWSALIGPVSGHQERIKEADSVGVKTVVNHKERE